MRHLTAVHIEGGWHYASVSRRGGGPIGYCTEHAPHATEQEARECYSRYRRDNLRLDATLSDWTGCKADGCDEPTKDAATIWGDGFALAPLCKEHLVAHVAYEALGLNRPAGDAWTC